MLRVVAHHAGNRRKNAEDRLEEGGLAAAIGAEQRQALSSHDGE
jgi:hypothetical protein